MTQALYAHMNNKTIKRKRAGRVGQGEGPEFKSQKKKQKKHRL
jgi:hypothetical protein